MHREGERKKKEKKEMQSLVASCKLTFAFLLSSTPVNTPRKEKERKSLSRGGKRRGTKGALAPCPPS